jgi:hypothetical protein
VRTKSTFVIVALVTALALMLSAGTATALRSIEATLERGERVEDRAGGLTFTEPGGGFAIVCEVIKELAINRAIPKRNGAEFGRVTGMRVARCAGGVVRVLVLNLPWIIRYVSFTGTLPNIRELRLKVEGMEILLEAFFALARCLYEGEPEMVTKGNPITEDVRDERVAIPLLINLGGFECPPQVVIRGTLRWNPPVRIRLI